MTCSIKITARILFFILLLAPSFGRAQQATFTNSFGMTFVQIPSGTFVMGSPADEPGRGNDEKQQAIFLDSFYMQTTEVTQEQWKKVMGDNPSCFKNCGDDCPVECVSWNDAQDFIIKLNKREKAGTYRLPTEAEWEFAARAGSQSRYFFGDDPSMLAQYAWYKENADGKTHPVKQLNPNPWGLYDIYGNVWEWCDDLYDKPDESDESLKGYYRSSSGDNMLTRGGSWFSEASYCRSAYRFVYLPKVKIYYQGFRLVMSTQRP